MKFSEKDLSRIREQGLTMQQVEDQLHRFSIGYPFVHLDRAAVVGDGIERIDEKTASKYADAYDSFAKDAKVVKFVPASGAASRMFKDLYDFLGSCGETGGENNLSAYVRRTMDNIDSFAFSEKLEESLRKDGKGLHDCLKAKDYREIVRHNMKGELSSFPCFYCRGAWNIAQMNFLDRTLCKLLRNAVRKKAPEDYAPWEAALMEAGDENRDWTDKKYLEPILAKVNALLSKTF